MLRKRKTNLAPPHSPNKKSRGDDFSFLQLFCLDAFFKTSVSRRSSHFSSEDFEPGFVLGLVSCEAYAVEVHLRFGVGEGDGESVSVVSYDAEADVGREAGERGVFHDFAEGFLVVLHAEFRIRHFPADDRAPDAYVFHHEEVFPVQFIEADGRVVCSLVRGRQAGAEVL